MKTKIRAKNDAPGEIGSYIEDLIEKHIKPEVRKLFVYNFSDKIKYQNRMIVLAETILGLNPPLITFYTEPIGSLIALKGTDIDRIKRIISHEIAHVFKSNEHDANKNQNLNIWT